MEFLKEFDFKPKTAFSYAKGGEEVFVEKITLRAPTMSVGKHTMILTQQFKAAQTGMLKDLLNAMTEKMKEGLAHRESVKGKKAEEKVKGADVVEALMSGGADVEACTNAFLSIITAVDSKNRPFCVIDGTEKMTQTIFRDMNPNDVLEMLGEYLANFMVASQSN